MRFRIISAATTIFALTLSVNAQAGFFTGQMDVATYDGGGWTEFQDNSPVEDGANNPGVGGQDFDAEYLFYRWDGSELNILLQTGFDVCDWGGGGTDVTCDGQVKYGSKKYWAGDIALSFDGDHDYDNSDGIDSSTWEYGVDWGARTRTYSGGTDINHTGTGGIDPAGLYDVDVWNNAIYSGHHASDPYAIGAVNSMVEALTVNTGAYIASLDTYYRHVAFDTSGLSITGGIGVHWTMSCGNDNINGTIDVPEPESVALILLGLLALAGSTVRRRRMGHDHLFEA